MDKYFVFRLRWSQTDSELVVKIAQTKEAARAKIGGNARYVDYLGSANI